MLELEDDWQLQTFLSKLPLYCLQKQPLHELGDFYTSLYHHLIEQYRFRKKPTAVFGAIDENDEYGITVPL
jgi:hypothetical protein